MRIIRSGVMGFCMGVRRAIEIAMREVYLESAWSAPPVVFTLGPLIHNPRALADLKKRGVEVLENESAEAAAALPDNSVVIIRAHGVSPVVERCFNCRKLRIVDATCQRVKANQIKAMDFARKGYWIFLAGEETHGEIIGIRGYAESHAAEGTRCFVVGNPEEAAAAAAELCRRESEAKAVLIGQTTIREEEYRAIGEEIKKFFPGLEILDTICSATAERQNALRELCGKTDAVIIAGGHDSANTRRLLSLAVEMGKPAWIVESNEDLPAEIGAYNTVGLSAGASTPNELIDEIEEALQKADNR